MNTRFTGLMTVMLGGALLLASVSHAQTYPQQPLRMVVPFPPSGGADILARVMAQKLSESLRVQVLVENRAGAGGMIGSEYVARATPDGYTLVFSTSSSLAVNPHVVPKAAYDPIRDFSSIMLVATAPNVLVVHPSLPATSVKSLIALAKARPGELNIASNGTGTLSHLMAELFMLRAGVKLVHVPYKGAAPAVIDTLAGNVSVLFASFPSVSTQMRAGRLRALAVTSAKRAKVAPDLPTVSEALPGFEANQWWGVSAPAGTPAAVIARLNTELNKVVQDAEVKKRFAVLAAEIVGGSARDFDAYLKSDYDRWGEVVKAAHIRGG
jgi:tripartite-type tricarboxylate transporter receptor subunit TctC